MVSYVVHEKGEYIIFVKWGDEHIPGSPFRVVAWKNAFIIWIIFTKIFVKLISRKKYPRRTIPPKCTCTLKKSTTILHLNKPWPWCRINSDDAKKKLLIYLYTTYIIICLFLFFWWTEILLSLKLLLFYLFITLFSLLLLPKSELGKSWFLYIILSSTKLEIHSPSYYT